MDHPQFIQILCAALCLLTIFEFCLGLDTLSANQTLVDGKVLISPGQIFELGFFSRGTSSSKFLGIWYKATPDIIVWVANRNNPIIDSQGVLTLAKNGTLVLSTAQSATIWSSNSSRAASSPVLKLLDNGNLVLVDKLTADSSSQEGYMWQSFDYPCDTRLPGMKMVQDPETGENKYLTSWKSADDPSSGEFSYKIENSGLSQIIITNGTKRTYRDIFWNGRFIGFPSLPDPVWKIEVESNRGRLISVFRPFNDTIKIRSTMNYSGSVQHYMMNEQKDGWILVTAMPSDKCDNYGFCGHNTICKSYRTTVCECLRGFKPKSEKERRLFNWKSGCNRNLTLDCQKEDGFLKVEGITFPDSLNFRLNTSMTIRECHDECLKKCSCTAYADPYFHNESSCLMWFGDLIDIREHTEEANAGPSIYIRVPVSELDSNKKRKGPAKFIFIAAAAGFGMLILGLSIGGIFLRMRCKRRAYKKTREEIELPLFDLATIAAATNNFSGENMIGEGGFGPENANSVEIILKNYQ